MQRTSRSVPILASVLLVLSSSLLAGSPRDNDPLVYSVNRTPERSFQTARSVRVITAEELHRYNARTLPEALMQAGIFVQQTNYGGGAPILRGLMGKQILILVDGVKFNNATYRFGPLQYLNTIDLNLVDRVEIVRGVGSVLGSDALGGVINILTRRGSLGGRNKPTGATLGTRYSTADEAVTAHAATFGLTERFRYLAGATHRESGDVEGGGSVGTQTGTGYREEAGHFSEEFFPNDDRTLSFRTQFLEQDEVPRTDRISSGRNLLFDFEPQRMSLTSLVYQDLTDRGWQDILQVTLYHNRQREGRREIRSADPETLRVLNDQQTVWGFSLEMGNYVGYHRVLWGIDLCTEKIHSGRVDVDLVSGETSVKRGNYTDRASYRNAALYLQDRFAAAENVDLSLGARLNYFRSGGEEVSSVGILNLDTTQTDFTGAVHAVFHSSDRLNVIAGVTRGFRAPNLDDLSVFDERTSGTEVPNTGIESEKVMQYELGVKYSGNRLTGSAFGYYSAFSDLLTRSIGTWNGLDFFDLNDNGIQDLDEPTVLQKQNIGEAVIEGLELEGSFQLRPGLTLSGDLTATHGEDTVADVPLRRIPPVHGRLSLLWAVEGGRHPWVEGALYYALSQTHLSPGDIDDSRIGPYGTDGFQVFTVRAGLTFAGRVRVTLAAENLTDERYKYHGSGFYRPGRQFVVGARYEY